MKNKTKQKIFIIAGICCVLVGGVLFAITRPNTTNAFNKKTYLVDDNLGLSLDVSKL